MVTESTSVKSDPATARILERFLREPAPLLPILHGIQREFGRLEEGALLQVAGALRIPISHLYGTISFYHYFRLAGERDPEERSICGGPACRLGQLARIQARIAGPVRTVSCVGRCDRRVPILEADAAASVLSLAEERVCSAPFESPLPHETGLPECVFRNLRSGREFEPEAALDLLAAVRKHPEQALETLKQSSLTGKGGAGFPTGLKWEMVRDRQETVKYVVCNADEGEPGCFKDRALMDHDPHGFLLGMRLAGAITGARVGFIYLRYEYKETEQLLERAIQEARAAGYLDAEFRVYLRRGAGAYICGEETALLNSLEGERPFPRERPPYPTVAGLFGKPTVINNVETLAAVPPILRQGADWYRALGVGDHAGTKIFSVSGDIIRPGNYELPVGTPLSDLIHRHAGGIPGGRKLKAVTMAGISGGFLGKDDLDVSLAAEPLRAIGSTLGAGGIIVYDESRCMVRAALDCARFFRDESCGKCFPCRIGAVRVAEMLEELLLPKPLRMESRAARDAELDDLCKVMTEASACGLGTAVPAIPRSLQRYWREEVAAHLDGHCPAGECGA